MASEDKSLYKFLGADRAGERVDRVVLEGSSTNPVRWVDVGGEAELTETEVEELRKGSGLKFRKVGTADSTDSDDNGGGDDAPNVETKEDQQRAQVASGAQHPAADPAKDNTPTGREAAGKKKT